MESGTSQSIELFLLVWDGKRQNERHIRQIETERQREREREGEREWEIYIDRERRGKKDWSRERENEIERGMCVCVEGLEYYW